MSPSRYVYRKSCWLELSNRSPKAFQELAACFFEYPRFKLHWPGCGTHAPLADNGAAATTTTPASRSVRGVERFIVSERSF
jgi:hypothetical protein